MLKPQRPSANETRQKILAAAEQVFLEKGFDGTSIKDIAAIACVNNNLIFHHFINKESLWIKVKERIMEQYNISPPYNLNSPKEFFEGLLDYRFKIYNNPKLVRVIQWQHLTEHHSALIGREVKEWQDKIELFQKNGQIRNDLESFHIIIFIAYSSHAPFLQDFTILNGEQKLSYKKMLLEIYCNSFLTPKAEG